MFAPALEQEARHRGDDPGPVGARDQQARGVVGRGSAHRPSVADGGGRELGDEPVLVEALERERRDQLGRPAACATSSASVLPTIGAALKPYVPQPAQTWKFSTSVLPRIGL